MEYRHEDGRWARGQPGAVRRDEAELSQVDRDWCVALTDEPRPDRVGRPGWQRLHIAETSD
jgi:hypothetical protein